MPLTISSDKLVTWATEHAAAGDLPWLIRRLVRLEVGPAAVVEFETGTGIYFGDFDGHVDTGTQVGRVPAGRSVWEVSANRSASRKASGDYRKRTMETDESVRRDCTYIQVSLRRWADKGKWSKARANERKWRGVLAFDAEDIAEWLQQHQALQIQLAEKMGVTGTGACPLDSWWQNWSRDGGFSSDWLLAGRGDELDRLTALLTRGAPRITIRSRSEAESLAFLFGAMKRLPEGVSEMLLARTLYLPTLDAVANTGPIANGAILIPPFKLDGHFEGLLAGKAVINCGTVGDEGAIELPPVNSRELAERMHRDGVDWEVAHEASKAARTSVELMRKRLGGSPIKFEIPERVPAKFVRAAVLCNRWSLANPFDLSVLAELSGVRESEVEDLVRLLSETKMPLVRRSGKGCFLTDEATAWYEIRAAISRTELSTFQEIVARCLAPVDPAFSLPPEERWLAGLTSPMRQEPSGFLKAGLARSLAAIAEQDQPVGDYARGQSFVDQVVRDQLRNADEERWFSISQLLPLLAEAAPDVFLEELADDLEKDQPASIRGLFAPGADPLSRASRHVELIWALERLCWNPDYLISATKILCDLHERQFGESNGASPLRSLHQIFLSWHPATYADVDTRLRALDSLRSSHPSVSWEVLSGLLPPDQGIAIPTSRPGVTRREETRSPTNGEVFRVRDQIVRWVLDDAGTDPKRLATIASAFAGYPDTWRVPALDLLETQSPRMLDDESRYIVWDAMRVKSVQHRRFADAAWAMTCEQCDRYEAVMALYRPLEPILCVSWLFSRWVDLPKPDSNREQNMKEVAALRRDAIHSVFSGRGLDGISALAARAAHPNLIGELLQMNGLLLPETERRFLSEWVGSSEPYLDAVACGYCCVAVRDSGLNWINTLWDNNAFSGSQKARLLQCAQTNEETWMLVDASPQEVQDQYWGQMYGWIDPSWSINQIQYWTSKMLQHGRAEVAVDQLMLCLQQSRLSDISALLLQAMIALKEQGQIETVRWSNWSHDISEALRVLSESAVDQDTVAMLEFYFYPTLPYGYEPIAFGNALAMSPQLFLEMASLFYRTRPEGYVQSDQERSLALNACELLDNWNVIPGATDGVVDELKLRAWIDSVLEGSIDERLRNASLYCLGSVLSRSIVDSDGNWPQIAICLVIEHYASPYLDDGLIIGRRKLRAMTSRVFDAGGALEREEQAKYQNWATARASYRRTRRVLMSISECYAQDALRQDEQSAIAQDLG